MEKEPTVHDLTEAYSLDAVDHANLAFGVTLDFAPASIGDVETVLEGLYDARPTGFVAKLLGRGPSSSDIERMAKMYGSYVGEVIRRHCGGAWEMTENGPTLTKDDAKVWPIAKVYKRLTNGSEDNVAVYYAALVDEHWPKG